MPLVMPDPNVTPIKPAGMDSVTQALNLGNVAQQMALGQLAIQRQTATLPADIAKSQAQSSEAQTSAQAAKWGLSKDQSNWFLNRAAALYNDPDIQNGNSEGALAKIRDVREQAVNAGMDPNLADAQTAPFITMAAHNPQGLKQAFQNVLMANSGAGGQINANQPSYTSTGGSLQQTNPFATGSQPSMPVTLGPQNVEAIEKDPVGNSWVVTRTPSGAIVGTRPMPGSTSPGGGGFPSFTPGQAQEIEGAQKEVTNVRQAADQAPILHNINQNILRLSGDTSTGPGTAYWKNALGALVPIADLKNVNDYQEIGKFLEQNAVRAMQSMGGNPSDARLGAALAANGSPSFNPQALQEVTKFNDAANTALSSYRQGLDKAVGLKNSDYTALARYKSDWAKNMDVNIYRLQNALQSGDQGELQKLKSDLGANGLKTLAQKRINLETLTQTGRLPQ